MKLEIALAIPASNDEKWNSYTSISGSWHAPRPGSQRVKLHVVPVLKQHFGQTFIQLQFHDLMDYNQPFTRQVV